MKNKSFYRKFVDWWNDFKKENTLNIIAKKGKAKPTMSLPIKYVAIPPTIAVIKTKP